MLFAECGDVAGVEAVYAVIRWREEGAFQIGPVTEYPTENISMPNDFVLMEGCRLLDEGSEIQGSGIRTHHTLTTMKEGLLWRLFQQDLMIHEPDLFYLPLHRHFVPEQVPEDDLVIDRLQEGHVIQDFLFLTVSNDISMRFTHLATFP